ncbi:MAG TPA: hypothetical protein VM925_32850 [Labilithrix sp.]|nr:hypothetical protein [Labilithrix sp.]
MSEPMLRGYMLQRATKFIEHHFPEAQVAKMKAGFPESLRTTLQQLKPVEWYPRTHCVVLHRAIADAAGPAGAYEALVSLGEFMATEATNTFLQLALRMLNPVLFCKKVPSFWQRDHSAGEFAVERVDNEAKRIEMRLSNVEHFDHVGAAAVGFVRFGMKAVGAQAKIEQIGWSLENPAPREIQYKISWA